MPWWKPSTIKFRLLSWDEETAWMSWLYVIRTPFGNSCSLTSSWNFPYNHRARDNREIYVTLSPEFFIRVSRSKFYPKSLSLWKILRSIPYFPFSKTYNGSIRSWRRSPFPNWAHLRERPTTSGPKSRFLWRQNGKDGRPRPRPDPQWLLLSPQLRRPRNAQSNNDRHPPLFRAGPPLARLRRLLPPANQTCLRPRGQIGHLPQRSAHEPKLARPFRTGPRYQHTSLVRRYQGRIDLPSHPRRHRLFPNQTGSGSTRPTSR